MHIPTPSMPGKWYRLDGMHRGPKEGSHPLRLSISHLRVAAGRLKDLLRETQSQSVSVGHGASLIGRDAMEGDGHRSRKRKGAGQTNGGGNEKCVRGTVEPRPARVGARRAMDLFRLAEELQKQVDFASGPDFAVDIADMNPHSGRLDAKGFGDAAVVQPPPNKIAPWTSRGVNSNRLCRMDHCRSSNTEAARACPAALKPQGPVLGHRVTGPPSAALRQLLQERLRLR